MKSKSSKSTKVINSKNGGNSGVKANHVGILKKFMRYLTQLDDTELFISIIGLIFILIIVFDLWAHLRGLI